MDKNLPIELSRMQDMITSAFEPMFESLFKSIAKSQIETNDIVRQLRTILTEYEENLAPALKEIYQAGVIYGETKVYVALKKRMNLNREVFNFKVDKSLQKLLVALSKQNALTHAELAKQMNMKANALSNLLSRNENYYDYIYLTISDHDKRARYYSLNRRGTELLAHAKPPIESPASSRPDYYAYANEGGYIEYEERRSLAFAE